MENYKTIGQGNDKFSVIEFENYIFPEILKLKQKYSNDNDFGYHVRKLLNNKDTNKNFPGIQNL